MKIIPISEAKTHLPRILDKLIKGNESIQITRHGVAIARIVPEKAFDGSRIESIISQIKSARRGARLNGLTTKQLREIGRR